MKRFCYRCGALEPDAGPLIRGLCQRCFAEEFNLLRAPPKVGVVVCKRCGAYMLGKQWYTHTPGERIEGAIREAVLDQLRVIRLTKSGTQLLRPQEAREVEIAIEPDLKGELIKVRAQGKVHELQSQPKLEETNIKLSVNYRTCKTCSLKRAGYHEAILQVRGELSRDDLPKIRRALESLASEAGAREERDFIAEVKKQRGGLDFYVSSVQLARQMSSLLRDRFGASVSESAKLIGQTRDGRQRFKVTILARLK
ncbi:MAG: 60S ribosomal export protein NMD3 [Candidatus Hodarchaeaceae archaeon]|nr:60S ribosomal export protein NMD3 [Candidatus Hodarchaeaceae archaeon]